MAAFVAGRFRGSVGSGGPGGSGGRPFRDEVILDLPADVISRYTREGLVEELGPDRCRLVLGSWPWTGLAATVGRFDADIEAVGPAELKDAFARLTDRCAKAASAAPLAPPASSDASPAPEDVPRSRV